MCIVNSEYYEGVMDRLIGYVYIVNFWVKAYIFDPSQFSPNDINASDQL